jgi:Host cell surface-exposed lipoprotein
MTNGQDWRQPGQNPQEGYNQPWQRQQDDPYAHQQRLGAPPRGTAGQRYPSQQQPWGQPQFGQQQPTGQPRQPRDQQYPPQAPPWQQQPVPPQRAPKRKPWPARHKVLSAFIAAGAIAITAIAASSSNKPISPAADSTTAASNSASPAAAPSSATASSAPSTPTAPASSSMTTAQQQAVDAAQSYLGEGQGFSKQGLLGQLTSSDGNGFSKSDAKFAINYLKPNWDQQSVDAANGYLSEGQGFSEQGLLQQLTSSAGDGFTEAQAEYAIDSLHPDWNAQAVDAAKGYMQMGGFSQASLIQQLTSSYGDGFTQAQAEYAASKVGL